MELDDLKAGWKKETASEIEIRRKDMDQLQSMLHNKTTDLLTRIRKRYEMIISCLLISVLLYTIIHPVISDDFTYPGSTSGFVKGMLLYILVVFFYWLKLVSVNNLNPSNEIKDRLSQMLRMLRRNLRIEMGFVVLVFTGGPLVSRFVYHGKAFTDLDDIGVRIAVPAGILLLGVILYIIRNRYTKNIRELEGYLAEYAETTNDSIVK
ncbi:MAG TPA: hypothetical protein VIH22_01470 [Cyclobacteriaceae bacterium]|jgi:hypothetical protein